MKTVHMESFNTFDEAQYYMETMLLANSGKFIEDARLQYMNNRWQAAMIFSESQGDLFE